MPSDQNKLQPPSWLNADEDVAAISTPATNGAHSPIVSTPTGGAASPSGDFAPVTAGQSSWGAMASPSLPSPFDQQPAPQSSEPSTPVAPVQPIIAPAPQPEPQHSAPGTHQQASIAQYQSGPVIAPQQYAGGSPHEQQYAQQQYAQPQPAPQQYFSQPADQQQFPAPTADPWNPGQQIRQHQGVPADFRSATPPRPVSSIDDLDIIKRAKRPPERGVGKFLFKVTGGKINTGQSQAEIEHGELVRRVNHPVRGVYKVAFLSLKGGVGKTTVAKTVGSTFASLRGDRIIAIDANPDLGTLADREKREHKYTVRDLLADGNIRTYSDVRHYTSQGDSRLEILASEEDPATSEALNEEDYLDTLRILEVHYNIILTDCGTGIMHSAMNGILKEANALVVISPTAQDGARSAAATLSWLTQHGYGDLVNRTIVAINSTRPGESRLDLEQLESVFRQHGVRAVKTLPFDEHLGEGGPIDLRLLNRKTRQAYLELTAYLADDFPESAGRHSPR